MKKDMDAAIEKSVDRKQTPAYLPAVAGDVPTYGKERAYSEMLDSGELTAEQADSHREEFGGERWFDVRAATLRRKH